MTRLLLIEDDSETADEVAGYFRRRGYDVDCAATGPDGLAQAGAGRADVLVVDRLLPGLDGLAVIEALRHAGVRTPALVLSALDERVRGLRAGGDDYLGKPFALAELAARIEALLRRPANGTETVLRVGPLELNLVTRTARRGDRVLELLPREFRLLEYMMRRAGRTITRTMLFEDVWNYRFTPRSNLVDVHMGRLRRKLDAADEAELLSNVRGIGFMLDAPPGMRPARQKTVQALRALAASPAFRWTLTIAGGFTAMALLLFAFIYWQTPVHEQGRIDGIVLSKARAIADAPGAEAESRLEAWLADDPHGVRYGGLFGPDGARAGGNILEPPAGLPVDGLAHQAATATATGRSSCAGWPKGLGVGGSATGGYWCWAMTSTSWTRCRGSSGVRWASAWPRPCCCR